jgi:ferredoxin
MNTYLVDINRSTHCGLCANVCPEQAIQIVAKQARIPAASCNPCGKCLTISKRSAIQVVNMPIPPLPVTIDRPLVWQTHRQPLCQRWGTAHGRLLNLTGSYQREDAS